MARKKAEQNFSGGPVRPDIEFDDNSLLAGETKQTAAPDYAAQLATLQATMQRLEEANSNLQRTNMALMGQSVVQQQPQFGPTEVSLDNLPDPVTNPKEYAQAIIQRGDAVLQTRAQQQNWQQQQQQDMQTKLDNIWEQFGTAYKGYAGNPDLVEAAATKAVQAARAQGIDPNKYMFAATPQFFADTVKVLEGWGIKGEAGEEDEVDDKPTQRTSGIPGGIESSGKLTTAADPDDAGIPSLMDELKAWKMKTGFYA